MKVRVKNPCMNRIAELEKKVTSLEERLIALEKHRGLKESIGTLPCEELKAAETIEFEDKQYRRVYRKAQPGDVVVFERTNRPEWVTVGKPYKAEEIEGDLMFTDDDGDHCFIYDGHVTRHKFEDVIVYEPIQEEKSPNQLRAETIEKAKEFVENILGEYETFRITIGKYKNQNVRAVFRVNTNKRASLH